MPDKPTTADGYRSEQVGLVRGTCLYVATKLGDIMDELVVIGGLVPSLLIEQNDEWAVGRRYFSLSSMALLKAQKGESVALLAS